MAKSLYSIQMDFKKANDCAAKLDEIARELKNLENSEFQIEINNIAANWKGGNANDYVEKCNQLKSKLLKTSNQIYRTADTIRKVAKNTYDAEKRAYEIALIRRK